jgi:hypothetical protein
MLRRSPWVIRRFARPSDFAQRAVHFPRIIRQMVVTEPPLSAILAARHCDGRASADRAEVRMVGSRHIGHTRETLRSAEAPAPSSYSALQTTSDLADPLAEDDCRGSFRSRQRFHVLAARCTSGPRQLRLGLFGAMRAGSGDSLNMRSASRTTRPLLASNIRGPILSVGMAATLAFTTDGGGAIRPRSLKTQGRTSPLRRSN